MPDLSISVTGYFLSVSYWFLLEVVDFHRVGVAGSHSEASDIRCIAIYRDGSCLVFILAFDGSLVESISDSVSGLDKRS
jgi:hypothetical protein